MLESGQRKIQEIRNPATLKWPLKESNNNKIIKDKKLPLKTGSPSSLVTGTGLSQTTVFKLEHLNGNPHKAIYKWGIWSSCASNPIKPREEDEDEDEEKTMQKSTFDFPIFFSLAVSFSHWGAVIFLCFYTPMTRFYGH